MVSEQLTRDRILEAASSLLQKSLFKRLEFEKLPNVQDALIQLFIFILKIRMKFCLKLLVLH